MAPNTAGEPHWGQAAPLRRRTVDRYGRSLEAPLVVTVCRGAKKARIVRPDLWMFFVKLRSKPNAGANQLVKGSSIEKALQIRSGADSNEKVLAISHVT
jgi:hypothetical protein